MKKVITIIVVILLLTGCKSTIISKREDNTTSYENNGEIKNMNVFLLINDNKYKVEIEDNSTTKELIKHLPLELDSKELNGNEKYNYLDFSLPTNSYHPEEIKTGDIMLYNDNCLVLFYDTFKTSYSYTKIGHVDIDNIKELVGTDSIKIKIIVEEDGKME